MELAPMEFGVGVLLVVIALVIWTAWCAYLERR